MKKLLLLLLLISALVQAQNNITWTDVTSTYSLPEGVKLFKGTRTSPALNAWYLDVDMKSSKVAVRSYISKASGGREGLVPFVQRVGAIAGINGGFFDMSTGASYSALVDLGQVKAKNIGAVTRSGKSYPLTRSMFGITETREMSIDWVYHYGNGINEIRKFKQPSANADGTPAPLPGAATGDPYYDLLVAVGGGPTLVKNGAVKLTYTEEVFWGSGVGQDNGDPRSAVGYTADQHVIMLAADGRQPASAGVSLPELARIMISLGCVEAMNLDGGGSTQMAVGSKLVNSPEGGTYQRPVSTILAVVSADSVHFLPPIFYNRKIDNGDNECTLTGSGWANSNIGGYWGTTPSKIAPKGNGSNYAAYKLNLPKSAEYEIFAWWTAAATRCKDTPFIIKHSKGTDTVRIDQTINGSKWTRIGLFTFSGDSTDKVIISDAATIGTNVVIDAIRILSYDSTIATSVNGEPLEAGADKFELKQNYPNPFNPSTSISYTIPAAGYMSLKVYDLLGNEIATLDEGYKSSGTYRTEFNAHSLASGVYFYRLSAGSYSGVRKMVLIR